MKRRDDIHPARVRAFTEVVDAATRSKPIRKELLDKLLAEYANPEDFAGPDGLLKRLTGAQVERALHAELTDHLGYEHSAAEGQGSGTEVSPDLISRVTDAVHDIVFFDALVLSV